MALRELSTATCLLMPSPVPEMSRHFLSPAAAGPMAKPVIPSRIANDIWRRMMTPFFLPHTECPSSTKSKRGVIALAGVDERRAYLSDRLTCQPHFPSCRRAAWILRHLGAFHVGPGQAG